jgi:hypothetical protein
MKSSTSLEKGNEVFWFGTNMNGTFDLIYGTVKHADGENHYYVVEEINGGRSLSTDNPYDLIEFNSIMKSHEIQYIR